MTTKRTTTTDAESTIVIKSITETPAPRRRTRKKDEPKTPKWTIVSALDNILVKAVKCNLTDTFWKSVNEPLEFLKAELDLTPMQILVLAMLIDAGQSLNWKNFANYLGCSRLKVMVHSEDILQLVEKRWVWSRHVNDSNELEFALEHGVVDALSKNKKFVPEPIENLTEKQFYSRLNRHIRYACHDYKHNFSDELELIMRLCNANPDLEVVKIMNNIIGDEYDKMIWLMIVDDYIEWNNTPDEGLLKSTIEDNFPDDISASISVSDMSDGTSSLYSLGYVEMKCEDGIADNDRYCLTQKSKSILFPDSSLLNSKRKKRNSSANDLKKAKSIKEKTLFYNPAEGEKMEKLTKLLSQDQFPLVQQRLGEQGLRKGFACLFYGGPGVGKTESVYQIARQTGRDIMQVNIAGMKDKFVGESEKNIKQVFTRYRQLCQECKVMPILLFNEADALINKRSTHADSAVDKMDNAMQNILLQELEDLDGILIATTNLTANLDHAFERRFLFKVEFHNPSVDVKEKIWTSMVSEITDEEAHELAKKYDLSPGQIENVARKKAIDYIINGVQPTLERLSAYCQDEQLASDTKPQRIAGFSA